MTGNDAAVHQDIESATVAEDDAGWYSDPNFSDSFDIANTKNADRESLWRWREATFVLNASRRFRYTLDLNKDEEKDQRRRMIRAHAQVIRAAVLFRLAGQRAIATPPSPSGTYKIGLEQLVSMSRDQKHSALQEYVGVKGLSDMLKTNLETGISGDVNVLSERRNAFGSNTYPVKKGRSFLMFLWEAWQDKISIYDIVVGDVVPLKIGDQVLADGILICGHSLAIDESSMTGESKIVQKNQKAPFLMSGCKVADGAGTMLILEHILHPHRYQPWILDPNRKPQIETLLEKASSLKELFENSSSVTRDEVQNLENRIRDAAHEAEDVVERHLVDQHHMSPEGESFMISPPDVHKVIGEFDAVKEEMTKIMEGTQIRGTTSLLPVSSGVDPNPKNIVVGLNEDLIQLKDWLTGQHSKDREVIPIVGMGGIGKTTLARNLYDDPLAVYHFDKRAWTTISEDYDVREILSGLLRSLTEGQIEQVGNDALGLRLHQTLCGRRYLIVLDDMWSSEAWEDIKAFFPNNNNGSRILVTTRESSVANCAGSQRLHHQMNLLSADDSWNLLFKKVFPGETCPPELEEIGKEIAKDCKGLPLAIHVVGGLLSELGRNEESWKQVAEDVSSVVASQEDQQISNILSLSYKHLPNHLRPCFLYLGAFPEDYEIRSSELIRLWVAEGFLKPIPGESLEEAAKAYLKALVDRSLLIVEKQEIKGKVKSYKMHDLLRDLCIRKAYEENFLLAMTSTMQNFCPTDKPCLRRVSAHTLDHLRSITTATELSTVVRSIPFIGERYKECDFDILGLPMLRVLNMLHNKIQEFQEQEIGKLVNLRYLACALDSKLPSSISTLCNLQTLIVKCRSPCEEVHEIFHMLRLRHIKFRLMMCRLSLPPGGSVVLQDLQTLSGVEIDNNFPKILEVMPNLKKLGISARYSDLNSCTIDLTRQSKTFKCRSVWSRAPGFPPSLGELTVGSFKIPRGYMNKIGTTFPLLEVLKLKHSYFEGQTWEPTEGEFCRLRILLLHDLNLEKWIVDKTHYPRLECLFIRNCYALEEIPSGIGEISTLQTIEVDEDSSLSAVASARKIQVEQLQLGNQKLRVHINAVLTSHFDEDAHGESVVLQNVETLSTIEVGSSFPKFLEAVPNLKKLGISGRLFDSNTSGMDLTRVSKLETLKCKCFWGLRPSALSFLIFPPSLKKLSLYRCTIPIGCMNKIGALPNLEVLKLRYSELEGRTWEAVKGEFCQLQSLVLEGLDLQKWIANRDPYPRLERLVIRDCRFLEEIPSAIAGNVTLRIIEVDEGGSSSYSVASARKIKKERPSLEVRIVDRINHFEEDLEENSNSVGLQDIETLFPVDIDNSFGKILDAIPNLKKSGIFERLSSSSLDLTCLTKLETLKCKGMRNSSAFLSSLVFPPSLKKLTMHGCLISGGCMNKIGSLPNLEVLKLRLITFECGTWEPTEGEFCRLRVLMLQGMWGLKKWIADWTHYPRLERLVIEGCQSLEEIPRGIGDIPTLQKIEMGIPFLRSSLRASARKIQEEQEELGNEALQFIIRSP